MATKSTANNKNYDEGRRLHPVRAWIAFALAMTLFFGGIASALSVIGEIYDVRAQIERSWFNWMQFSCYETDSYWKVLFHYFDLFDRFLLPNAKSAQVPDADASEAVTPALTPKSSPYLGYTSYYDYLSAYLDADVLRQNIAYSAIDTASGLHLEAGQQELHGTEGIALSGGNFYIVTRNGNPIPGTDYYGVPAANNPNLREYMRDHEISAEDYSADSVIVLLPNSRIIEHGGLLSSCAMEAFACGCLLWGILAAILLVFFLFLYSALSRRSRRAAGAAFGRFLGRIWIEVRLLLLTLYILSFVAAIDADEIVGFIYTAATAWFFLYCIIVDLRTNRLHTFACNIINSIVTIVRRRQARLPLHKALSRRPFVSCILPITLCILGAICCFAICADVDNWIGVYFGCNGCYLVIACLVFLILYCKRRNEDYADIAAIMNRICEIREGRGTPLTIPEYHRFAPYAVALERIYAGIELAVNERTRSERTKIEMVTNISHDLKTPLTSIVGYADLLSAVEGLPPEAADYIKVITQKSARLNALIKDLFELSKATTADLPLRIEPLDLTRLLHQLLAEQADAITAAPVMLVTDLPEHECPIQNDGNRLYRVFANLLENALRYSLDGSRVFLCLTPVRAADGSPAYRVTIRNTARELIDFTAEEILARFVRGDKNRSTEGNGLGLPIAKSFTELCGGHFDLKLDGDVFLVTIELPGDTTPRHNTLPAQLTQTEGETT